MLFWLLATALTLLVLGTLYLAYKNAVTKNVDVQNEDQHADPQRSHDRKVLAEIDTDLKMERISAAEAEAARAELARDILRRQNQRSDQGSGNGTDQSRNNKGALAPVFWSCLLLTIGLSAGTYLYLGSPQLPSSPLAGRELPPAEQLTLDQAVARIEARLTEVPDDVEGWQALAPVYMRLERFEDAANAFSRINQLTTPDADSLTDEAEAQIMLNNGNGGPQVDALLRRAAAMDPAHIRSRYYIAGQASQEGDWPEAEKWWGELVDLSTGDEPWLGVAQRGLAIAQNDGIDPSSADRNSGIEGLGLDQDQQEQVQGMVSGLAERLYAEGGTIEEWTRLVRSRLVLGDVEAAQADFEQAAQAYPDEVERAALDQLAQSAGLAMPNTSASEANETE